MIKPLRIISHLVYTKPFGGTLIMGEQNTPPATSSDSGYHQAYHLTNACMPSQIYQVNPINGDRGHPHNPLVNRESSHLRVLCIWEAPK